MTQLTTSINALTQPLVEALIEDASLLDLKIIHHQTGAIILDAGIDHLGCVEAGRRIAEICMGGLGRVSVNNDSPFASYPASISVESSSPVLSCLASQYAGWALQHEQFFSLGSGPARAIAQREDIFKALNYQDVAQKTVLVLETNKIPPSEVVKKVSNDTKIKPENLTFILTPTTSLAGGIQIVARVLEVALHKAHTLHFPLNQITSGAGSAPLPPSSQDFLMAMGRTNDAILFGGAVKLNVMCNDNEAEKLAHALPSSASIDYGRPFADIFKSVGMDFYQIDPLLFSPAKVSITNLSTGHSFEGGSLDESLLVKSFSH